MPEKKIAVLVINSLKGGGAEKCVLTLGKAFHKLGYAVHIIKLKEKIEYELPVELNYHCFKVKRFNIFPKSIRYFIISRLLDIFILKIIGKPSFVLSNLELCDKILSYSQLKNTALIIHNNISTKHHVLLSAPNASKAFSWIKKTYAKKPCICVSHGIEKDLNVLLTPQKSITINNPLDKEQIIQMADQPLPDSLSSKVRDMLETGDFLVHAGSFKAQKAHDVLLKAYAKSTRQLPLLLLGQGQLMHATKELAEDLGIADKVYFLGFHGNPYPFIKRATALVLSSNYEGFGLVIAEAQILETPVISTDCPHGPNEMLPSKNLSPVGNVATLSAQLNACMEKPQTFFVPFDERLLPENIAKQYEDFFANLEEKS